MQIATMAFTFLTMDTILESGIAPALTALLIAVFVAVYICLVQSLRFRHTQAIQRKYTAKLGEAKSGLTVNDAYDITMSLATLEFPTTFTSGVRLGMFKSYAIPTISNLLMRTSHFDDLETTSRRAANTGALLTEIFFHPPGSSRGIHATARTNFLHSGYRKNGHISNEDMLYTLALSIVEPIRLINRYEWRSLSPLEVNALGTYWKSLGETLDISYLDLPSMAWHDGQEWLQELDEWARAYERRNMQWSQANFTVAHHAADTLGSLQRHAVNTLLEEERRQAIGFTSPPLAYSISLEPVLAARRFCVRHLCLPRLRPVQMTGIPSSEPGHYWARNWYSRPWYTKATRWARYGPSAWWRRLLNQPCPGDDGYQPQGYDPQQIGPVALQGKGHEFIEQEKARLSGLTGSRCPFTGQSGSKCPHLG